MPNRLHAVSLSGQVFSVETSERIILKTASGEFRPVVLLGVEAPTMQSPAGKAARRFLHRLMAGKFVTVDYHALTPKAEILGTLLHGGADINQRLIESGLVRVSADKRLHATTRRNYLQAQKQAQQNLLGLWRQSR